jgi:hypothetical protein
MNIAYAALEARPLRRCRFATAILIATLIDSVVCARPANLDLLLQRRTDHDAFHVDLASGTTPVPLSKVHQWSVHVTELNGNPVTGASLNIDGGMPEHGHGLPTAPRAESAGTPGDYLIKGMKFSMRGWWVLKVNIRAPDGRADQITFNIVL